jgi:hypothetical protein
VSIDPNLITAQWGLISAFGVAVTLLAARADQNRQDYMRSASDIDRRRTSQWVRLVRATPVAVFIAVILLTVLAAPAAPSGWTEARQEYSILALPLLAQLGFIYILWRLVPPLALKRTQLQVGDMFPESAGSQQDTFVNVANESDEVLTVWWVDKSGHPVDQERPKMNVAAGAEVKVHGKSGDCWLIRTQRGTNVGFLQADDEPVIAEVHQKEVDAAPEPRISNLLDIQGALPCSESIGGIVVAITIVNKTDRPITAEWINRQGQLDSTRIAQILSGSEFTWYTWPGHYWLVQTQSNDKIGLIHAQAIPTIVEVDQQAMDRASLRLKEDSV